MTTIPQVMQWSSLRNEYDEEGNPTVAVYNDNSKIEVVLSINELSPPTVGPFTLHSVCFPPSRSCSY